jgi:drug/metabolite transporter (DMT)-like permease
VSAAVVAAYLTCALIWGTTWFAIRVCIGPDRYSTLIALALRFGIAAVILLPLAVRVRPWPRGRAWSYLLLAGVLDAAAYVLVYLGEERVSGGVASVVYGTLPLVLGFVLTAARLERLKRRDIVGACVSLAGVVILMLDRMDAAPDQGLGVMLVFASVVLTAIYSTLVKRHGEGVPALVSTAIFITTTAVVLGAVALVSGEEMSIPSASEPTVALLYLAVFGSAVTFLVYFWLLRKAGLLVTSTLVFIYPMIALTTDALFERAITLGPLAYVGAAITLAGLAVSLRKR